MRATGATEEPGSPVLDRVRRGALCAGCGACAAAAPGKIEMGFSETGLLRPAQSSALSEAEEARIAAVCPGVRLSRRRDAVDPGAPAPAEHPLWGPIVAVRSGHAADESLRYTASSGGALSALLVHLLESGAVEGVLQIAPDPANPAGNRTVLSRTPAEVMAAAGSRYAPSSPLEALEPHLAAGRRFAVVGKPCDIAALRALARGDPRIDDCVPYMLSFFCAGVPSQRGAEAVIEALGATPGAVSGFRYRGNGWPGFATATLADGRELRMSYDESWGRILTGYVQFRCRICPDGTGGFADVACADAWACDEAGYPLFDEADGMSLIVARTARGEALVSAALAAGRIVASPFDPERISAIQPGQHGRLTALAARILALRLLGRTVPRYRGFGHVRAARQASWRYLLRNFLGTAWRTLSGKYREERWPRARCSRASKDVNAIR